MIIYFNEKIFSLLHSKEIDVEQLVILNTIYNKEDIILDGFFSPEKNLEGYTKIRDLELKGFLIRNEALKVELTQYGLSFIKKYLESITSDDMNSATVDYIIESKAPKEDNSELFTFCTEFASLFKKDNCGIAGKYQRPSELMAKMERWMKEFPGHSYEKILQCTRDYIDELKNRNESKFIMECGYFLYKRTELTKGSEKSKLGNLIIEYKPKKEEEKQEPKDTKGLF